MLLWRKVFELRKTIGRKRPTGTNGQFCGETVETQTYDKKMGK